MKKDIKRILGLDIGIASLGWAISAYDDTKEEWYIEDFGVRLWNSSEEPKTKASNAQQRREYRSSRRNIRRTQQRKNDLKNFFIKEGLLNYEQIEEHFEKLKIKNNGYDSENEEINPLFLRKKGLTKQLTPLQLFIVSYNYAKHRGYENEFSLETEKRLENSKEKMKDYDYPIDHIINNMTTKGFYRNTVVVKEEKLNILKKSADDWMLYLRKDFKREYADILKKQLEFFPSLNEEKTKILINDLVFRQRVFEDSTGPRNKDENYQQMIKSRKQNYYPSFHESIGNCTYYHDEKRVSKSSVYSDLFIILNEISKITASINDSEKLKNIYQKIIKKYLVELKFDKTTTEKIFNEEGQEINLERKGVSFEKGSFFLVKLNKLDKNWLTKELKEIDGNYLNLDGSTIEKVGNVFGNYMTPRKIINELSDLIKFESRDEFLNNVKKAAFTSGRQNVSKKYIIDLINHILNEGKSVQDFSYTILEKNKKSDLEKRMRDMKVNSNNAFYHSFKPNLNNDADMIKNPVVFRSLNQIRLVMRALLKKYGSFSTINFETARDLYSGLEKRKSIEKQQAENEKKNNIIKIEIEKVGAIVNQTNIEKYKLWEHQKRKKSDNFAIDLYDLNLKDKITLDRLFSDDYEVDHIIPYSVKNDNTIWNKVLTKKVRNQFKGKKTPLEFFNKNYSEKEKNSWKKGLETFEVFKKGNLKKTSNSKKMGYLLSNNIASFEDDFESRNLNDVRYIAKYIETYFDKEFEIYSKLSKFEKPKINSIVGAVTSNLRREWLGSKNPWGLNEKVRDITPYHHSIDAIVLSQFESFSSIQIATLLLSTRKYYEYLIRKIKNVKENFSKEEGVLELKNLKEKISKFINNVNTSKKDREKNGILSKPGNYIKISEKRKNKSLSFIDKLINNLENNVYKTEFLNIPSLIRGFSAKVENLIPLNLEIRDEARDVEYKLEDGTKKVATKKFKIPKLSDNWKVTPQEWANLNNKKIEDFPYPSWKISKRVRGVIAKDNPGSKKNYEKNKEKFFIDQNNTIWEKTKYIGVDLNSGKKLARYDAQKDYQNNNKHSNILGLNSCFEFKNEIKIFKSVTGDYLNMSHPFFTWNGYEKYRKMVDDPHIQFKNSKNFKIKYISILGKIQ